MREITLSVSEFKAKCLSLLADVETKGACIVIARRGRPFARVAPIHATKPRLKGIWKGLARIKGDIVYFSDNPWECEAD